MTDRLRSHHEITKHALVAGGAGVEVERFVAMLRGDGYQIHAVGATDEATQAADGQGFALAAIDGAMGVRAAALAARLRAGHPHLPLVWIGPRQEEAIADVFLDGMHDPRALSEAVDRLLCLKFYPAAIVDGFVECTTAALAQGFGVEHTVGAVTLKANCQALGQVSGIVPFCGDDVAGEVLVCASGEYLRSTRKTFVGARNRAGINHSADLAGEVCNQIVGRFKVLCSSQGLRFNLGLPVFVIGRDVSVHYGTGRPAITLTLSNPRGTVYVELCLTQSRAVGEAVSSEESLEGGEISFL